MFSMKAKALHSTSEGVRGGYDEFLRLGIDMMDLARWRRLLPSSLLLATQRRMTRASSLTTNREVCANINAIL